MSALLNVAARTTSALLHAIGNDIEGLRRAKSTGAKSRQLNATYAVDNKRTQVTLVYKFKTFEFCSRN